MRRLSWWDICLYIVWFEGQWLNFAQVGVAGNVHVTFVIHGTVIRFLWSVWAVTLAVLLSMQKLVQPLLAGTGLFFGVYRGRAFGKDLLGTDVINSVKGCVSMLPSLAPVFPVWLSYVIVSSLSSCIMLAVTDDPGKQMNTNSLGLHGSSIHNEFVYVTQSKMLGTNKLQHN